MNHRKYYHINPKELIEIIQQLKILNTVEKHKVMKYIKFLRACRDKDERYAEKKKNEPQ